MIEQIIEDINRKIPNGRYRSILLHLAFWFVWLSRNMYDIITPWGWKFGLLYIGVIFITQAPLVYVHLYVLVPRLLMKRRYTIYAIITISAVYLYSVCNYSLAEALPRQNMPDSMVHFLERLKPNYDVLEGMIVLILTYALKYTLIAFITQNELLRLQKEKLNLELNALKSQIHPHFLFNTLNNLYSLTLKNSSKASEVVLKLSDIMRYVLYQANEEKVPLSSEIDFIRNFTELQRIRYDASSEINLVIEGDPSDKEVAPLLFIDFVENAFKHGLEKRYREGFVRTSFVIRENELVFTVENSKSDQDEISETSRPGGIGLMNVKKRLALIYGDKHSLSIIDTPETFRIQLNILFS